MRQQLVEAKREVAVAIADEKRLSAQLDAELEQVREWERRATIAVQKGEDDLAREALRRKAEREQIALGYKQQWNAQQASTEQLKSALRALSQKNRGSGTQEKPSRRTPEAGSGAEAHSRGHGRTHRHQCL
jgi:phage shock protein A